MKNRFLFLMCVVPFIWFRFDLHLKPVVFLRSAIFVRGHSCSPSAAGSGEPSLYLEQIFLTVGFKSARQTLLADELNFSGRCWRSWIAPIPLVKMMRISSLGFSAWDLFWLTDFCSCLPARSFRSTLQSTSFFPHRSCALCSFWRTLVGWSVSTAGCNLFLFLLSL
jgi:hypothetical protein